MSHQFSNTPKTERNIEHNQPNLKEQSPDSSLSTAIVPAATLPERISFSQEMSDLAFKYMERHQRNITKACEMPDNICDSSLLEGIVYAHELIKQHNTHQAKSVYPYSQEPVPQPDQLILPPVNTNYGPSSLQEMAQTVSENMRRFSFSSNQLGEDEIKFALAQYYTDFLQQSNDVMGIAHHDLVGLAQNEAYRLKQNPDKWEDIKVHFDSPEVVAFVEKAYEYAQGEIRKPTRQP